MIFVDHRRMIIVKILIMRIPVKLGIIFWMIMDNDELNDSDELEYDKILAKDRDV